MSDYFIKRGEKVHGPFTAEQIRSGLKSKKLTGKDEAAVSRDGPWDLLSVFLHEIQSKPKQETVETSSDSLEFIIDTKADRSQSAPPKAHSKRTQKHRRTKSKHAWLIGGVAAVLFVACALSTILYSSYIKRQEKERIEQRIEQEVQRAQTLVDRKISLYEKNLEKADLLMLKGDELANHLVDGFSHLINPEVNEYWDEAEKRPAVVEARNKLDEFIGSCTKDLDRALAAFSAEQAASGASHIEIRTSETCMRIYGNYSDALFRAGYSIEEILKFLDARNEIIEKVVLVQKSKDANSK